MIEQSSALASVSEPGNDVQALIDNDPHLKPVKLYHMNSFVSRNWSSGGSGVSPFSSVIAAPNPSPDLSNSHALANVYATMIQQGEQQEQHHTLTKSNINTAPTPSVNVVFGLNNLNEDDDDDDENEYEQAYTQFERSCHQHVSAPIVADGHSARRIKIRQRVFDEV